MKMYKEKIVNAETGEVTWRDYTEAEIAEVNANIAKIETEALARQTAEAQKTAEKAALLSKLGITEDEAKLLLS